MTDEEKAEKFVKENCCDFCINKDDCEMGCIDCHTKEGVLYGLAEGRKEAEKQWHDCFLSCSSPYCAGHFPVVKLEGELGNMSKHEGE